MTLFYVSGEGGRVFVIVVLFLAGGLLTVMVLFCLVRGEFSLLFVLLLGGLFMLCIFVGCDLIF